VIVTGADVRNAAETTLRSNLPDALGLLADRLSIDLPAPADGSWAKLEDFRVLSDLQSPSIIVTCSGLPDSPQEDEDSWQPLWRVRAFAVVRGRSYEETADRVTHYTAAIRTTWGRHRSLGGLATGGWWRGESFTELDRDRERTVAAGSVTFDFAVPVTLELPTTEALSTHLDITGFGPTHPALVEGT
jgi:hypothetical protein